MSRIRTQPLLFLLLLVLGVLSWSFLVGLVLRLRGGAWLLAFAVACIMHA